MDGPWRRGAKKGVRPFVRPSSIDPMRHCNPDEKSPPQGGRERGEETRSCYEGMGRATSLMSDRIHLQCGIITLIAEWMICQCMRGEYIYMYCAEGERGK